MSAKRLTGEHVGGARVMSLLATMALMACGDPVERHIAMLAEGGELADEAKIELNLAKKTAIPPLIAALENQSYPVRARADIAQALYRLYLREADARILSALIEGLQDPEPRVRASVARALGDLRKEEGVPPLIDGLERDADDRVRYEIMVALETFGMEDTEVLTRRMADADRDRFTELLVKMSHDDLSDSLQRKTSDWLESLAEEQSRRARELELKADLQGTEEILLAARELVPHSKNINQKLARFYYDNGERERGIEMLSKRGMLAYASRLDRRPEIDGIIDGDPAWSAVVPLSDFYQCISKMGAYPITGKSEAYVGYVDNSLYVGVRGYEASTENLSAESTGRDGGGIAHDDCVEIFLDTNHDYRSYYHWIINSAAAFADRHNDGNQWVGDIDWNGDVEIANQSRADLLDRGDRDRRLGASRHHHCAGRRVGFQCSQGAHDERFRIRSVGAHLRLRAPARSLRISGVRIEFTDTLIVATAFQQDSQG